MKLRKKEIKVPKNFSVPPWRLPVSCIDNSDFLKSCADRYDLIGDRSARRLRLKMFPKTFQPRKSKFPRVFQGFSKGGKVCFPPLENDRSPRGADDQTAINLGKVMVG